MLFNNTENNFENLIARSADLANKPFIHSVVINSEKYISSFEDIDITLQILCRDIDGKRLKPQDLELEIYSSNKQTVIVLSKLNFPNEPILWFGSKIIWMNSNDGKKCIPPNYSFKLENLAVRIKALLE